MIKKFDEFISESVDPLDEWTRKILEELRKKDITIVVEDVDKGTKSFVDISTTLSNLNFEDITYLDANMALNYMYSVETETIVRQFLTKELNRTDRTNVCVIIRQFYRLLPSFQNDFLVTLKDCLPNIKIIKTSDLYNRVKGGVKKINTD